MPATPVGVLRRAHVAIRLRILPSRLPEDLLDLAVLSPLAHPLLQVPV